MKVYVVNKNGQPAHVTLCERDAKQHFDETIVDGDYKTLTLLAIAGNLANTDVLCRTKQAA